MVEDFKAELRAHPGLQIIAEEEIAAPGWYWPWERGPRFQRAHDAVGRLLDEHDDLAAIVPVDIGGYDGAAKKLTESFVTTKVVWPGMSATGLILFAIFMSVFCGAVTGSGTGVLATRFSIPPFIATLAIMLMARSLAISMTRSEAISNLPHDFTAWHNGFIFEARIGQWLPVPGLFMALIYLAGHVLMTRTQFGRYVYAIGGNEEATRLSGVRTGRIKIWVYLINGALAGFVAALTAAKLAAGDPKTGVLKELDVIASVVVGGTSLSGGEGKVLGTLIGALLIGVVRNALNLLGFPDTLQDFAIGAAILGAVLLDVAKKRL
ncbi:ABC transporter permease [bacterium]|nr:ABC transporter permease [bacterium]